MSMPHVAVLGLGRMGAPIARRLLDAGVPLTVWNRSPDRAAPLATTGARLGASPADAARDADVVITMLADPAAVEAVLHGDHGALGAIRPGTLLIDCSTVGPDDARATARIAASRGVRFIDAPVLGSVGQATNGELVALAGGDEDDVARARPVLERFAKRVVRVGPVGSASALKLVMNLLVGGFAELLSEAIVLADGAGVPRDVFRETLMSSVLASPFVGYKAPQLLDQNFAPLFSTALLLKDLNLALHLADDANVSLPATRVIRDLYARSASAGRGGLDFSAVILQLLEEQAR
jgi:3-hydroxyisobutyrate dehydrogenase-like beta-hydroxyacid dehydrogenase